MQKAAHPVFRNIQKYKRKFYLNLLLRGAIWSLAVILAVFLVVTFTEYFAHFSKAVRAGLFFGFILVASLVLWRWILSPLWKLFTLERSFSDEEAARQIGSSFPAVRDKLINLLQLQNNSSSQGQLLMASIQQKSNEIGPLRFDTAISYQSNTRYLKYLLPLLLLFLAAALFLPGLFTDSAGRIVRYQQDFTPEAPFRFVLQNEELQAFRNEDYTVNLDFEGGTQPQTAYMWLNGRRIKMQQQAGGFTYTFAKVQEDKEIYFEAAGFESGRYRLKVVERPALQNFQVELFYPAYLQKKNERLSNVGNFQIPEGTEVNWQFKPLFTDSIRISFVESNKDSILYNTDNEIVNFSKQLTQSQVYELRLFNEWSTNKEPIRYQIEVIKDRHPSISLNPFADTTLFNFIVLGGSVSDDYGLSRLNLYYKVKRAASTKEASYKSIPLKLEASQLNQNYYLRWPLDSLKINKGDELEYFVKVWDNDGVNGAKSAQTTIHSLRAPDTKALKEAVNKAEQSAEKGLNESIKQAQELEQKIQKAEERLRGKNRVNYQDEKTLQEILEERKRMEKQLQELKEQTEALKEQKERFSDKQKEKIKQQSEQLQQLMDELLDEETKKLYDELQKLLEEKKESEDFQNVLKDLGNKEKNLEKELERALELFKRMKFDSESG